VKSRLKRSALGLSGGQQQASLHRARDRRPAGRDSARRAASALDPISTSAIEDLMHELKNE